MILTFASITAIIAISLIYSVIVRDEGWSIVLGIALFIVGLVVWGFIFSGNTERVETKIYPAKIVEILKGKHITVVVTDAGESDSHIYSGYSSDKIDSTTKFIWQEDRDINYYGIELRKSKTLLIKNDKSKN